MKNLIKRVSDWNNSCDNVFFDTKLKMHWFCFKWAVAIIAVIIMLVAWIYFLMNQNIY